MQSLPKKRDPLSFFIKAFVRYFFAPENFFHSPTPQKKEGRKGPLFLSLAIKLGQTKRSKGRKEEEEEEEGIKT